MFKHVIRLSAQRSAPSRYQISVVAIFRNESHILLEWIEHYLAFGIEHFYLIDNNSTDTYRDILAPYIERGIVDLFFTSKDGFQIGAYMELLPKLKVESEWIGVFDMDEFIYPPHEQSFGEVLDIFADHAVILIPWLSFGSSGFVHQPCTVTKSFVRRGPAQVSRAFLKAFSRTLHIGLLSQHNPDITVGTKVLADGTPFGSEHHIVLDESQVSKFRLLNNHYRLQSLNYFTNVKTARPEVHENVASSRKAISFFEENDQFWNEILDTGIVSARERCTSRGSVALAKVDADRAFSR